MNTLVGPVPLPEEYCLGYLGRVIRINGLRSVKETQKLMLNMFELQHLSPRECSLLEPLSRMAGMSAEKFALGHTTLSYRRAITSYLPDLAHGSLSRRTVLGVSGTASARSGAYFCAKCAKADVKFHGVSYWRRDLQLPGHLWCPKHGAPLNFLDTDDAFLSFPSEFKHSEVVSTSLVEEAQDNSYVLKYMDIVSGLSDRQKPLDVKYVSMTLRRRAAERGLQTHGGTVKSPLLSDLIQSAFPTRWLTTVLAALVDKPQGQILNQVDGVLYLRNSASSVAPYVLAAAMLYETADDALNCLIDSPNTYGDVQTRKPLKAGEEDLMKLMAVYIESKGSHGTVANSLERPVHQVTSLLNGLGLPNLMIRRGGKVSALAAVLAFRMKGMSTAESARIGGLTTDELDEINRQSGPNLTIALPSMCGRQSKKASSRKGNAMLPATDRLMPA